MKRDRGVNPLRNQEYQTSDIKVVLTRKKNITKKERKGENLNLYLHSLWKYLKKCFRIVLGESSCSIKSCFEP